MKIDIFLTKSKKLFTVFFVCEYVEFIELKFSLTNEKNIVKLEKV